MSLKELQVRNAKPKDKPYKLNDGLGLYLYVSPKGSKLWRMKYQFERKEKLLSFGPYPKISLATAREKRAQARQSLSSGQDPMTTSRAPSLAHDDTFETIARRWHENRESSLDPAHATRVMSRMERDIFPAIGKLHIDKISAPDVLALIRKIEERGALDISRRAKQCVGQVYQFAIASGWATADPTSHLRGALKPRPRVQHMSRVPVRELPQFLVKLENYKEENSRRSLVTKNAVAFALLTWVRSKELRFAAVQEFEGLGSGDAVWRIPAHRMKMGREHLVPLSRQAEEIVERLIGNNETDYLFPGVKPQNPLSENTMIFALYRMGYLGRQTVHGFRSLGSTWANEQLIEFGNPTVWVRKYHEDWIEMQLAHADENEVRSAYNAAEYLAPRKLMMQDWADFIDSQKNIGLAKAFTGEKSVPSLRLVAKR